MAKHGKSSGIPVAIMFAFGRGCYRPLISSSGVSPYTQVSNRLEKLGHPKESGQLPKAHCKKFIELIYATASGYGKAPTKAIKVQSYASKTQAQAQRQSTEASVLVFVQKHSNANPRADNFLDTFEWKAVRMMALKKYGAVCQCCGASPSTGVVINVDHIKPRKIFPDLALEIDNLQVLCGDCNHGKGNWDMTDWRAPSSAVDDSEAMAMLKAHC